MSHHLVISIPTHYTLNYLQHLHSCSFFFLLTSTVKLYRSGSGCKQVRCSHVYTHEHVRRSKSWQAHTLTLTLMSLTDTVSDNRSGRATKSARPPVTCQRQQACITMRKSSMERWGQTGNSLPLSSSSDEGYHHIGLGKPLCQPMHLFSVEPMRTALFDDTVSSDGGRGGGGV